MSIDFKDLRAIRWQLLTTLLLIVLWGAAFWGLHQQHQSRTETLLAQQGLTSQNQQSQLSYRGQNQIMQTLLPQYQQLIDSGLVGEERRIEWLQALRDAQQRIRNIQYSITPKSTYTANFLPKLTKLSVQRSLMNIQFDARHEGDIVGFIKHLSLNTPAPFIWQACEIKRINTNYDPQAMNMHVECQLAWLTLREPVPMMGR